MNHPASLAVRQATPEDLTEVVAVERAAFDRTWEDATFATELARPDRRWLVGELGGAVVGVAGIADLAGDAHVLSLGVVPSRRRGGVASELLAALLRAAVRDLGSRRATLEVRTSNVAARTLYRRGGFVEAGVRPGYYGDGEDAVVLWCDDPLAAAERLDARDHGTVHAPTAPNPPVDPPEASE